MYITAKHHFLSKAICIVAVLNMLMECSNAGIRLLVGQQSTGFDMQNNIIYYSQLGVQFALIIVIAVVFTSSMRKLQQLTNVVSDDDKLEIAMLQQEYIKEKLPTLTAEAIYQLLQIWSAIFVLVQTMSIIANYQYRKFVDELTLAIPYKDPSSPAALALGTIYNSTHGFKYICMFTALILGIFITGIFLKDRLLKFISIGLSVLFMVSFAILEMTTILTCTRLISIVWTSIIFHGVETLGLLVLAMYLSRHYQGL